jgi:hypothetical protein
MAFRCFASSPMTAAFRLSIDSDSSLFAIRIPLFYAVKVRDFSAFEAGPLLTVKDRLLANRAHVIQRVYWSARHNLRAVASVAWPARSHTATASRTAFRVELGEAPGVAHGLSARPKVVTT